MKQPCVDCPFIKGSSTNMSLAEDRLTGIVSDVMNNHTFTCHKTLPLIEVDQQHCAGALIYLEKRDNPNQLMRIAERIGIYDRKRLEMNVKNLI